MSNGPWGYRAGGNSPEPEPTFYWCANCHAEILFGTVCYMSKPEGNAFTLAHTCDCKPGHLFDRRFQVDHPAMKRMLGKLRPPLPYAAYPGSYLQLSEKDEKLLKVWAWEVEQLEGPVEFLRFTSKRRGGNWQ